MPVKRRQSKRREGVTDAQFAYLRDEPFPEETGEFEKWAIEFDSPGVGPSIRELWADFRDEIITEWIAEAAGTRPSVWWRYDAPREPVGTWPGCYWDGTLPLPRQRIGGIGTPKHDVFAYVPQYRFGVPTLWIEEWEVEYYSGCTKDIHGEPIGQNLAGKHFAGLAIDLQNPPTFESTATYLDRHGLLWPGERKLTAADFAPERITDIFDFGSTI